MQVLSYLPALNEIAFLLIQVQSGSAVGLTVLPGQPGGSSAFDQSWLVHLVHLSQLILTMVVHAPSD